MNIKELHEKFLTSNGVSTDTRSIQKGAIFFALKGANFNGNKYAKKAVSAGACLAVIDEKEFEDENTALVLNVLETLQELAAYHRSYLNIPILAVTGSNGKTTTKELLHVVLNKKFYTHSTEGNLNNHIGIPLTLLQLTPDHEMAIIEMGANHKGEIASYCQWVKPDFGLITNIGKSHLEGFGGIEGVIKGKTELYKAIAQQEGTVFYNADDDILSEKSKLIDKRISYGFLKPADYKFTINTHQTFVTLEYKNEQINSHLIGAYNGINIAVAISIGLHFKVPLKDIKQAISDYVPSNNRSELIQYHENHIILDAYNANPSSMEVALSSFRKLNSTQQIVILGDMFEIGDTSNEEHKKIIDYAISLGFKQCVFVGHCFYEHKTAGALFFKTTEDAKKWFDEQNFKNKHILIKGSRGMKMEHLVR